MDWSVYDIADRFTLHDAGFLLIDLLPLKPVNKIQDGDPHETERQAAKCITDQLIFDAKNDQLKVQNIEGGDGLKDWKMSLASSREGRFISLYTFSSRWFVHRNDLIVWAESKGKKPAFLFKDGRKPKRESQIQTDNLKKALVCMAIDAYRYKPEDEKSSIPGELSKIFLDDFDFDISDRTIRDWLKEGKNLLKPTKT